MRILVCGGRDFPSSSQQRQSLRKALNKAHESTPITLLIHGGARGVDLATAPWARDKNIAIKEFPAQWKQYGRSAGHRRNAQMLTKGEPQGVIAFPGARGTSNMVAQAKKACVPVWFPLGSDWLIESQRPWQTQDSA
ncbi:MAG: DUF2493 domain-containing protein [Dehalococcoidia bacterium]|nr:DUF2493 domain-containing protein [Dehalococcoidia bacterium]